MSQIRQGQFQRQQQTDEDIVLNFSQQQAVKEEAQTEGQTEGQTEEGTDVRAAVQTETKPVRTRKILILQTALSGCERKLGKAGTNLRLERKPDYPEDHWAIIVRGAGGTFLGLIPFGANQSAARLMDAGKTISAVVADNLYEACVYMEIPVKEDEGENHE